MTPEQLTISDTEKNYNALLEKRYMIEATIKDNQSQLQDLLVQLGELEPIVVAEIEERNRVATEMGFDSSYTPPEEVDPALLEEVE